MKKLNLLELVYCLVERMMLSTEFSKDDLESLFGSIRDDLDKMRTHYETPAPDGTQAVAELMSEALTLFDSSFNEMTEFLFDQDEDRLRRAVLSAEEANDILAAVEDVIQTNKQVISEMVEA